MNSRERFFSFLDGRPVDRALLMPMTMMCAATRAGLPYGRYALDYHVLAEAQIHIAEEFGFDHVSTITETREARDCGATIRYFDDQPYAIDESQARLGDKRELAHLQSPDPLKAEAMQDRLQALSLLRDRVGKEKIIEGWVEGPCGAAADLRGINTLMLDFYDDPAFVRDLFEFVLDLALRFAKAQKDAGADTIGMGDAPASLVGPRLYREFVWPWEKRLIDGLRRDRRAHPPAHLRQHACYPRGSGAARLRYRGCRLGGSHGGSPRENGPRAGLAGRNRPGARASERDAGRNLCRGFGMPPRRRRPLHCRRGM